MVQICPTCSLENQHDDCFKCVSIAQLLPAAGLSVRRQILQTGQHTRTPPPSNTTSTGERTPLTLASMVSKSVDADYE